MVADYEKFRGVNSFLLAQNESKSLVVWSEMFPLAIGQQFKDDMTSLHPFDRLKLGFLLSKLVIRNWKSGINEKPSELYPGFVTI